jgi:ABC-type transport system involved in multi-copper enzyme maturation permease subunit
VTPAFLRLLHAEWTKFQTVRGWALAGPAAALMVVLVAALAGVSSDQRDRPDVPIGPAGGPVTDQFFFVHRPLTGDGSITVSVSALQSSLQTGRADLQPGTVPWAKAGLIIKDGTRQGSPYAAIMVTGSHGVRMQDDYVNDTAGRPGAASPAAPRWLRLERSGDAITGSDSTDGTHWTTVGTVHLAGVGSTVLGGLFVASPDHVRFPGSEPTVTTAVFGDLATRGGWVGDRWVGDQVGPGSHPAGSVTGSGDVRTVTGSGDIAPAVRAALGGAGTVAEILTGTFPAMVTVIVVGALSITTEYRDDLVRVTLAAAPRRARVLAAKAIVLGTVTFAAGLVGAAVAIPVGEHLARANGVYLFPVTPAEQLRIELGTAALLAATAILALAVGTLFRRSAGAVTTVTLAVVLPYLLVAQIPFVPAEVTGWLTRATPAAAFAVQRTLVPYPQVDSLYTAYNGYYPLAPWAGFAVLAGYAAVSLAAAAVVLNRRDA